MEQIIDILVPFNDRDNFEELAAIPEQDDVISTGDATDALY